MMSCEEYQNQITALIDGELDSTLVESIETHVNQCKTCKEFFATTRTVKRLVSQRPRLMAPFQLRARINRLLDKETQRPGILNWLGRLFKFNPLPAYAMACLLLFGIGFGLGRVTMPVNKTLTVVDSTPVSQAVSLKGHLVCINCTLHGHHGHPVFCKEHHHVLGIKLADGTIWSILENDKISGLKTDYVDMHKQIIIHGIAYPTSKYVEVHNYTIT